MFQDNLGSRFKDNSFSYPFEARAVVLLNLIWVISRSMEIEGTVQDQALTGQCLLTKKNEREYFPRNTDEILKIFCNIHCNNSVLGSSQNKSISQRAFSILMV